MDALAGVSGAVPASVAAASSVVALVTYLDALNYLTVCTAIAYNVAVWSWMVSL